MKASEDVSKYPGRSYHVNKTLGKRAQSRFAFEVLYLTDDMDNRSVFQPGWRWVGCRLCQILECYEEDGRNENKNKISHTKCVGQMHSLWLKLE